jgi:hypothetical protein
MRSVTLLGTIVLAGILVFGCGGKDKMKTLEVGDECIPRWFLKPPSSGDLIYGTGVGDKQTLSLAKQTSEARAFEQMARTIQTEVSVMMKDFAQEAGIGEDAEALEFVNNTSIQISQTQFKGAKIEERKVCKSSSYRVYTLTSLPRTEMDKKVAEAIRESALYNEFKASQAFNELDERTR